MVNLTRTKLPSNTRHQQQPIHSPSRSAPQLQAAGWLQLQHALTTPGLASPGTVLAVQRTAGNRAVQQWLANGIVQARLTTGAPNDACEQEADHTAWQVMRAVDLPSMPLGRTTPLSKSITHAHPQESQVRLQKGQTGGRVGLESGANVARRLSTLKNSGSPLPPATKLFMESRFGADFGSVRIHANSESVRLSRAINAQAFTHGADIFMGAGKYNPTSNVGKQLLAHELTHVIQQAGSRARPDGGAKTIQRKVGFEIETGIPITQQEYNLDISKDVYKDPGVKYGDKHEIKTGVGGTIKIDHVPGHIYEQEEPFNEWPIIEFVSDPIDETRRKDDFENLAKKWLILLGELRSFMASSPPPEMLENKVKSADADIYIGFPGKQKDIGNGGIDRVSIQMTIGARLDRLSEIMQTMGKTPESGNWNETAGKKYAAASESGTNVKKLMEYVNKNIKSPHKIKLFASNEEKKQIKAKRLQESEELRGFFVLITNYLLAGQKVEQGYVKNRSFLFYKSKLSDVWDELKESNKYAKQLQDKPLKQIKDQLLSINGRKGNEDVFKNIGVSCTTWLDEIFAGTDDQVFEKVRNPWSSELGPEKVGKDNRLAAVVELRSPTSHFEPKKVFDLSKDQDDIVAYLLYLYQVQQEWASDKKIK